MLAPILYFGGGAGVGLASAYLLNSSGSTISKLIDTGRDRSKHR